MRQGCREESHLSVSTFFTTWKPLDLESARRLSSDCSLRHGEDTKDVIIGNEDWQHWEAEVKRFKMKRQSGPALVFPTEKEVWEHVLAGVKQDEMCIEPQYLQPQEYWIGVQ